MADKKSVATNPDGRKKHVNQKYDPDYHPQHYANYKSIGCGIDEIAGFFGVNKSTVHGWIDRYPEMKQACDKFKVNLVSSAHRNLVRRANGYEYEEEKKVTENGNETRVEITTKQLAPDVGAIKHLLSRHSPEMWGDKEEEDTTVVVQNIMPVPVADSVDSWEEVAKTQQDSILNATK